MSLIQRIERKQLHPALLPRELRWRDIAYASFLVCGLVMGGAILLNWTPTDTWFYLGLAWLYRLPILFVFTGGTVLGTAFSLVAWREWRLPVLSLATLLTTSIPWLVMRWPSTSDLAVGGYLVGYPLVALSLPLWWYVVDRRRLLRRHPSSVEPEWLGPA